MLHLSELLLAIYELISRIFPTSIIKTKYTKGHEMYKKSVRKRKSRKSWAEKVHLSGFLPYKSRESYLPCCKQKG